MTWNAIFSSFLGRTGMASEWLKNELKCQFLSFPGMIGMRLEWLRNDWKCNFSSFLGMTGMTSEWCFDSFNAHSYHSCHSRFFCYIPSFQPHSAIQNSFRNYEQWGKWGMTSNEWPNLTTFPAEDERMHCVPLHLAMHCIAMCMLEILEPLLSLFNKGIHVI